MEDSIALIDALTAEPDIMRALSMFRLLREPQKQKLVSAAERSFMWYEGVAEKLKRLDTIPFIFDFVTRTGRIDKSRLSEEFPYFMDVHKDEWENFAASAVGHERGLA